MKWERARDKDGNPQDAAIRSGSFTISKAYVDGTSIYTLWHGDAMVKIYPGPEEAKEAALTLHAAGAR